MNDLITRPSQLPAVKRFDGLAYDAEEARAVLAEEKAWQLVSILEIACAVAFLTALTYWAFLTFGV